MMTVRSILAHAACLAVTVFSASPAGSTPLHPAYDLRGPGLSIAVAGAGMLGPTGRSQTLTVNVSGPVELALLYWAGRDYPCPEEEPGSGRCTIPVEPYKDQVLALDTLPVAGIRTGNESQPYAHAGAVDNIGYFADVTSQVRAKGTGRLSFTVADDDRGNNLAELDGAGLLVVYSDPAKTAPARVIVYHGLDFAYGEDFTSGDSEVTAPITFNHGAAHASVRRGELVIFAGNATSLRPDRIDITNNPSLLNALTGSSGAAWDARRFPVDLPIGAGATTVQLFSEPVTKNPDALLWEVAALWAPLPVPAGCSAAIWSGLGRDVWIQAGNHPEERVRDAFRESAPYGPVGVAMLGTAVRFRAGPGLLGAAKELAQAGTAALLNAGHPRVEYPLTKTQVIDRVDAALLSHDVGGILALAHELEAANGAGCPLR
jgi:hypothetical protein